MDAKEFLIKNKVDTSYVETFCNKNGWGKINLEDLLNSFIEHYKQAQALQLQQTGVVRSCSHENYTNYCNTDGSFSHKLCDDCFEMLD